jgi:hypothetical protein
MLHSKQIAQFGICTDRPHELKAKFNA